MGVIKIKVMNLVAYRISESEWIIGSTLQNQMDPHFVAFLLSHCDLTPGFPPHKCCSSGEVYVVSRDEFGYFAAQGIRIR
ncbi:hypothetical protein JHK85_012956 [Glycine max]|nr:hypothetical protein JHK85_012956 [Glycine max]